MRLTGCLTSVVALCLLAGCSTERSAVPSSPSPFNLDAAEHHGPGHSGGGGGGGGGGGAGENQEVQLALGGDVTSAAQTAVIDRDTKSALKILAGADNRLAAFTDALELFGAAGSPSPGALGACVVDPSDAPNGDVQDVIDRLDDAAQERGRIVIEIDKRKLGREGKHLLTHNWDDDAIGTRYRTWLKESTLLPGVLVTVTSPADDEYVFTGGSIVSWNLSTNVAIACPFIGAITVTVTR